MDREVRWKEKSEVGPGLATSMTTLPVMKNELHTPSPLRL